MKLKNLFITLGLSLAVGIGVGAGLKANKEVKEVKATTNYSVVVDIQYAKFDVTRNWIEDLPKLAVYFFDNDSHTGWSGLTSTVADTYIYTVNASLDFTPTKMIACRMNPAKDVANWDNKWSQTGDLNFGDVAIVADDIGVKYPVTKGLASEITLDNYHRSDSHNPEFYKQNVELAQNDAFKITYKSSDNAVLKDGVNATYFEVADSKIKCKVTGTYDLYFDGSDNKLWAQVDAVTEATVFANSFLGTTYDICLVDGENADHGTALAAIWNPKAEPDGTSLVEKWNALTSGAKGAFATGTANGTLASAKTRYLHIMGRYNGVLTAFEGGPHNASTTVANAVTVETNNTAILVVVIISASALVAVGGYFLLRKKKEN